jgi:hypothetical protein
MFELPRQLGIRFHLNRNRSNSARRAARLATENHGYTELRRAMARHGNAALRPLLDAWAERVTGPDPRAEPRLHSALTLLGTALYGPAAPPGSEGRLAGARDGIAGGSGWSHRRRP